MKNKFIILGVLIFLGIVLFFYLTNRKTENAKLDATKVCNSFYLDQDYISVKQSPYLLKLDPTNISESPDRNIIAFSFSGSSPFDRYVCRLEFKENRVINKEVVFID